MAHDPSELLDGGGDDDRAFATRTATTFGVDPDLVHRLIAAESDWNPQARSPKGAIGLMQLMPATAKDLGVDPTDPRANITGGVRYLKSLLDRYGGREDLALAAYNAGPGAVDAARGVPAFPETQAYVRRIQGAQRAASGAGTGTHDPSELQDAPASAAKGPVHTIAELAEPTAAPTPQAKPTGPIAAAGFDVPGSAKVTSPASPGSDQLPASPSAPRLPMPEPVRPPSEDEAYRNAGGLTISRQAVEDLGRWVNDLTLSLTPADHWAPTPLAPGRTDVYAAAKKATGIGPLRFPKVPEGESKFLNGLTALAGQLRQPPVISGEPHVTAAGPNRAATEAAVSDVLEGAFEGMAPLVMMALLTHPVTAVIGLGGSMAAAKAASTAVTAAGGTDEDARLAGNLAAMAGAIGTGLFLKAANRGIAKAGADARAVQRMAAEFDAAHPELAPEPPKPVGRGRAGRLLEPATKELPPSPTAGLPPEAPKPTPLATPEKLVEDITTADPTTEQGHHQIQTAAAELRRQGVPETTINDVLETARTATPSATAGPSAEDPAVQPGESVLHYQRRLGVGSAEATRRVDAARAAETPAPPTTESGGERGQQITKSEPDAVPSGPLAHSIEELAPTEGGPRVTWSKAKIIPTRQGVVAEPIAETHTFSSTQVTLPAPVATAVRAAAARIPDADLAGDGRETDPHVTVKYGLHTVDAAKVADVLRDEPPITVTLGKTSIFPARESGTADVVKVDVDSPDLHRLNAKIADALEHTDTHPTYQPHVTLAYVKPGEGQKYAGDATLAGQTVTIDHVTFTGKDGKVVDIPLGGKKPIEFESRSLQTGKTTTQTLPADLPRPIPPEQIQRDEYAQALTALQDKGVAYGPGGLKVRVVPRKEEGRYEIEITEKGQRRFDGNLSLGDAAEYGADTLAHLAASPTKAPVTPQIVPEKKHEAPAPHTSEELQSPAEGPTVTGATDVRSSPPSDRETLAGAPPADGAPVGSDGATLPSGGVRGEPDRGGVERPDATGGPSPTGGRTDAGAVGVPAERGGRPRQPGLADRPSAGLAGDYRIERGGELATGGERTRIASNLTAIQTLKQLEAEGRAPTPDEQATLAKYVGWGGLAPAFKDEHQDASALKAALTDAEYRAARASTPNAHYTSPTVIEGVYAALAQLGVTAPVRLLEPAAGVGHFLGLMPEALTARAHRTAVELDPISARITQALYPAATVHAMGFQDAPLRPDSFDLIVSNVPFGNYGVADATFKGRPKALTSAIHNYYFAKALDLVRPGGIVAFITSRYTLDALDSSVRKYLASKARFLGAIRLPDTAFKQNAGTEVVTDVIFLQRVGAQQQNPEAWVSTEPVTIDGETVRVNQYYARHPEMVLGTPAMTGSMYRDKTYTVTPSGDLATQLAEAVTHLPRGVYARPTTPATTPTLEQQLPAPAMGPHVREGSWFQNETGDLFQRQQGQGVRVTLPKEEARRVKGLLGVRDAIRGTMQAMLDPAATDAAVKRAQKTLTTTYDTFVKTHGYLKTRSNTRAFGEDPDLYTMLALEEWAPKAEKPEKAAIFTRRTLHPHVPVTSVGTPKEALMVALNESGRVDWSRMAALTGESEAHLQDALAGRVFHDPTSRTWEEADRYLSGNVKAKLAAAQTAAAADPAYTLNVQALAQVQPPDLEPADIAIRLGAPWVPPAVITSFASHLGLRGLEFRYSPALAKWTMNERRFAAYSVQNTEQWGTQRKHANDLLLMTLNLGDPIVRDTVTVDGVEKSVVNQKETIAARERQQAQKDEFQAWVWADPTRATRLARIYNDTMNTTVRWEPKGDHLELPGTSAAITFRPHQKNFVWRGLQEPNALAHHVVGAGKTFAGIALAMEKRRVGLARKPMVVVPNHLPQQWARDVLRLYPAARVLASQKSDFETGNRKRFLNRIATGDWDLVIVPESHFGRIRVKDETFNAYVQAELDNLEIEIVRAREEFGQKDPTIKELEKAKLNLQAKLRTAKDAQTKDDTLAFEDLGVDMLIVDEAHRFKKLWFPTKMTRVAGVPTDGSQKAFDLFIKSRYLAGANPTGGTVFLTGTPISNTMAEMFVLMRYLTQGALDARGIPQFDGWAATFGETVSAFEISPTGRGFRQKTRFARFTNMPELMQLYRAFADVQTADMLQLPTPKLKGGKAQVHAIPASTELVAYVDTLLDRYEAVLGQNGKQKPDPTEDNPLKITTDGRKAALDLRLVGLHQPEGGKVDTAAREIADIYTRTTKQRGAQLVFADLGAPAEKAEAGKFTVYAALKERLIELGVKPEEIAFIHDPKTDPQKVQLFENVRAGHVRVLIGSTEKMGAGMNVQDRLVALHHLDAPWRPSDIEQREGRILRQGNLFGDKELKAPEYDPTFQVEIHTYVSEQSFDAYLWQLLERKAAFILQALKGDTTSREIDDADDVVLSFGAVKAIATGNPAIMAHAKAQSDLARLEVSESNHGRRRWRLQQQVASLPEQIAAWETREADARTLVAATTLPPERKDVTLAPADGGAPVKGEEGVKVILAALDRSTKGPRTQTDAYHAATPLVVVGTAAGLEVRVSTTTSFVGDSPIVTQHWTIAAGDATLSRPATISTGAMASLINFIEHGPPDALEKATTELATLRSSLTVAQTEVVKPFTGADKVKALRTTIKALEASLNLDAKSLEAEAAATGVIVDEPGEATATAPDDDETDVATTDQPTPPKTSKGGITLQSTILPGAAEFGEHVVAPAAKAIAAEVRKNRDDLKALFAPDTLTPDATIGAGILRANLSARAQRTRRAQQTLRSVEKVMDRWSHEESLTFWDVMEGQARPDILDPETQTIARAFREILDAKREQVVERQLIRSYLENYWGHEWQQKAEGIQATLRRIFGKRPLQGPESYRKRRSIPTMRQGIEDAGLEPVSWNPTTQLLRKLLEMDKSITAYDIRKELKARGEAKFVAAGKKAPEGWVRFPESFGTVYGPQTVTTASGEEAKIPFGRLVAGYYYGPREVVRLLANHLSPGLRGKSAAFDLYRTAGNFLNQLQLGFSAFHAMMTGMEAIVSKQSLVFELLARGEVLTAAKTQLEVGPQAVLLDLIRGHRALKAFYAHDANAAVIDGLIGQVVQAGGGFGWDLFEHQNAPEAFLQALRGAGGAAARGDVGGVMGKLATAGWQTVPALTELAIKPIMEFWVPRLKMAAYLDLAAMELKTLGPEPDLTEVRRVLGQAWDSIDNRFGQLRYDNLFWHNALKDLGMASVRALGWNVGTIREMFGVVPAQLKQLGLTGGGGGKPPRRTVHTGTNAEGEPEYRQIPESRLHRKTAWFVSMVFMYGLAGAVLMYLTTGKRPKELRDYFFPESGELDAQGHPMRVSIAGYFKDLYAVTHDFPRSLFTTATHKIHPLLSLLADVLTNEDFFGTEIRNPDDPWVQQLGEVLRFVVKEYRPIVVANQQQRPGHGVESFFGITPAPASVRRTALENYLVAQIPARHRTQDQAEAANARRDVRSLLQAGKTPEAMAAAQAAGVQGPSLKATIRAAARGSLRTSFNFATWDQAIHAYGLGTPAERAVVFPQLAHKFRTALVGSTRDSRPDILDRYNAALKLPRDDAAAAR